MKKNNKEVAVLNLKSYPSTHRLIKIKAVEKGMTIPELLDLLIKSAKR